MECRKLEINLVSATDLPDVRSLGTMKVYATVSIKGHRKSTQKTPVDKQGGTNPIWNSTLHFTVAETALRQPGVTVVVKLMCKRSLGDRPVGQVYIEVKSLFDLGLKSDHILSYGIVGTNCGRLNLFYTFGQNKVLVANPMPLASGGDDVDAAEDVFYDAKQDYN